MPVHSARDHGAHSSEGSAGGVAQCFAVYDNGSREPKKSSVHLARLVLYAPAQLGPLQPQGLAAMPHYIRDELKRHVEADECAESPCEW